MFLLSHSQEAEGEAEWDWVWFKMVLVGGASDVYSQNAPSSKAPLPPAECDDI